MSANLLVDLANTSLPSTSGKPNVSIGPAAGVGATPASGTVIGQIVDLLEADTYCNLAVAAGPSVSGQFRIAVQNSDSTASGSFFDPTSGLSAFPGACLSGGIFVFNSGNTQMNSGGLGFGAFIRTGRYARAIILSGDQFNAPVTAGFVSQLKTVGSGQGYTFSPGSGTISV